MRASSPHLAPSPPLAPHTPKPPYPPPPPPHPLHRYGNVKNYAGSNHLIVPTGILQDLLHDSHYSNFGGGFVRVESTSSSAFLQLAVHGAEVTKQLPPRSRELLGLVNASGRYFEFYAARNYYSRPQDLDDCALKAIDDDEKGGGKKKVPQPLIATTEADDPPYVIPAYELRRALALARARGEPFAIRYTRLPKGLRTPSAWRAYKGASVEYSAPKSGRHGEGVSSCTVVEAGAVWPFGRSECDETELVNLPPLSWIVTKWLHPYPIPLLEGAGDGVHCTT